MVRPLILGRKNRGNPLHFTPPATILFIMDEGGRNEEKSMPVKYYFKPEANLIICVHSAQVSNAEFVKSYHALLENKMYDPSMNLLVDLRRADSSLRNRDALVKLARFVKSKYASVDLLPKIGVLAPQDLSFGLARMYEAMSDAIPWDFGVFRTLEEVLVWLGVAEEVIPEELI
jgi:hypothetical protein